MTSNIIVKFFFFFLAQHNEPGNTISQTNLNEASGVLTETHQALQVGEAATFDKSRSLLDFMSLFIEEREGNSRGEFERQTFF